MDDATADLILSLQLKDFAEIRENDASHASDDYIYALDLQLREFAATARDHSFGEQVGGAEDPDGLLTSPGLGAMPNVERVLAESFALLAVSGQAETNIENSSSAVQKQTPRACDACGDMKTELLYAPCGTHHYCKECTIQLFDLAMTDESMFPPRCCGEAIPLDLARPLLTAAKVHEFESKLPELSTMNRTYCHDPACGAFIPPPSIDGEKATCSWCSLVTCTVCKKQTHNGDCLEDPALESFLTTARAAGFQTCYQCNRMVELSVGCNHIRYASQQALLLFTDSLRCFCRAEFCYLCGERWKHCPCEQWNEDRLIDRAQVIVDRAPARNPVDNARRVEQEAQRLRARHECDHTAWHKVVLGNLMCENCNFQPGSYLLECRQCALRACVRCKRHRL